MPLSTLYIRGVFFLLGGKLLPFQGVLFILEHQFYQGVLSFGSENFSCMNFALNSLKKMHGNVGYYKYFVTFALDYENMN